MVQGIPSSQSLFTVHIPLSARTHGTGSLRQLPVVVLQISTVHTLPSSQSKFDLQQPEILVWVHSPVTELHEPVVHTSPSSQITGNPAQLPIRQTSPVVHTLPSSQEAPFCGSGSLRQLSVFVLQISTVHTLPLSQSKFDVHCACVVTRSAITLHAKTRSVEGFIAGQSSRNSLPRTTSMSHSRSRNLSLARKKKQ